MTRSIPDLMRRVARLLDEIHVDYVLGGSFASSMLGEPRATTDVDFAVMLDLDGLDRLLDAAANEFYVPAQAALDAVNGDQPYRSFNLIDQLGKGKVDIFVLGGAQLDRRQIERRVAVPLAEGGRVWVTAPQDIVVRKLGWIALGGPSDGQQWRDVVGVLAANIDTLDIEDLRATAAEIGVLELLDEALAEVAAE